jgi:hypothetical protein
VDEELLRDLPEEYAALGDRRTVMVEVDDELKELLPAVTRLGDALEYAGLPGREWRSRDAALRLLGRGFPRITVDDLITRLSQFAAEKGPEWLHGDERDLERFQQEVARLYRVVRRLHGIARRLRGDPPPTRSGPPIERAFATARVAEPLDRIIGILDDFDALGPFMRPLSPEEWQRPAGVSSESRDSPATWKPGTVRNTLPMPPSASHTRLLDFASGANEDDSGGRGLGRLIAVLRRWARTVLAQVLAHKQLASIALVLVVGAVIALLVAHQTPAAPSRSGTVLPGTATAEAATAEAMTPSPIPLETATKPPAPLPKLALACTAQNSTTQLLKITNTGTSALTWQAIPPAQLQVTQSQGHLDVGETYTAQVKSTNPHKSPTGTITVKATSGSASASFNVTCQ